MSYEVVLRPSQERAKVRNPWGVLGLAIVSLGIYVYFWWYFINREMRDLGRVRESRELGDSPGLSVVALLGSWLVVPGIWTLVTTCQRIQRAQRLVNCNNRLNGWVVALLAVVTLGLGVYVYMQIHLNKVWQSDEIEDQQQSRQPVPIERAPNGDLERLQHLASLRDSGTLTQEEFETEKARLFERSETT